MTDQTPISSETERAAADSHDLEIRDLFKIFGPDAERYIGAVKSGLGKDELNEKYNHVLGLQNIDLVIPSGKITVIMGLSGSGKSTLIRHINGLIKPTSGQILYDGEDVVQMNEAQLREFRRAKTAMVFQKFALLPHRTVLQNTVYGPKIRGISQKEADTRARYWIDRVGLAGYEDYYPKQLSGGMQQRVGLARALTNDAEILLMDEAFSALDPLIRHDMQAILLELQEELNKTIIFITHDLDEALRLGDKIALLRDGAIQQIGTGQEIVLYPANEYIANFVREVNRGRVIQAKTVANPIEPGTALPDFAVRANLPLDLVARRMTKADVATARVRAKDGTTIGTIDLPSILDAMVNPADAAVDTDD